jgi:UDP-N-acetylglucosamine acyltransferase
LPAIHPTAAIDPLARIADDVRIGPFCVIEADVTIGAGCVLEARVSVKDGTQLGSQNYVAEGAILGGRPQHLKAGEHVGRLVIGHGNQIREGATIHRAFQPGHETLVGDNNLFMANAHVAHDCHIGNNVILANNVMLAGHVAVEDKAYLSGAAGVHQFCRIGTLVMLGGQAHISRDVPPYVMLDGLSSTIVGLNNVGLRRAGFTREDISTLKAAYRLIYRSGLPFNEMLAALKAQFDTGPAARYHDFFATGKRGFMQERRSPRGATLKVHGRDAGLDEPSDLRKAG